MTKAQSLDLYVSPAGCDQWSGRLPQPDATSSDGPVATLLAARDRARAHSRERIQGSQAQGAGGGGITVWFCGGTYRLSEPLCLDQRDSGVTWAALPGQAPVIDAAESVRGWSPATINGVRAWRADVRGLLKRLGRPFSSLFVDGLRAPRARWPKTGFLRPTAVPDNPAEDKLHHGTSRLAIDAAAIPDSMELVGACVRLAHLWVDERLRVTGYDRAGGMLEFAERTVFMVRPGDSGWLRTRLYFDNVRQALTESGHWYLDEPEGAVYYVPRPGQEPATTEIVAPLVYQFVRIEGADSQKAQGIEIEGLTFRHADFVQPAGDWGRRFDPYRPADRWPPRDSYEHFVKQDGYDPGVAYGSAVQAAFNVPGCIRMRHARGCAIRRCRIEHAGFYGIELGEGSQGVLIESNLLRDLGAGGVSIDGGNGADAQMHARGNRVLDNLIEDCGCEFGAACGVLLAHAADNVVAHNEIRRLRYTGISVGWQWLRAPHVSRGNIIEKNHVHHICGPEVLSDLAGIYTLGIQPGTIIRSNAVHDIGCDQYGAWGIYLDAASANILVEGNVVWNTASECVNNNTGNCENLWRGNVLFGGASAAVGVARRPSDWLAEFGPGRAMTFVHNVVITRGGSVFRMRPPECQGDLQAYGRMVVSDANLFWDLPAQSPPVMVRDWRGNVLFNLDQWRAAGQDRSSTFRDPRLCEPSAELLRQDPLEPAAESGFDAVDLRDVGPRRK